MAINKKSAFEETLGFLGGIAKSAKNTLSSDISNLKSDYSSWSKNYENDQRQKQQKVKNFLSDSVKLNIPRNVVDFSNKISSLPYQRAEEKIQDVAQNKMPVNWSDPVARQQGVDKVMSNAPKWGGSYVPEVLKNIGSGFATNPDSWTGSLDPVGQMKEFSHPLQMTYNAPQIETSPLLENIKQNIISGLKPSAREFLSKVPIQFGKM